MLLFVARVESGGTQQASNTPPAPLQKQMEGIEEQVGALLRAVEASEEETRRLRGMVAGMQVANEAQQLEARTAREELLRVRKEALRASDQLEALQKAYALLQVVACPPGACLLTAGLLMACLLWQRRTSVNCSYGPGV